MQQVLGFASVQSSPRKEVICIWRPFSQKKNNKIQQPHPYKQKAKEGERIKKRLGNGGRKDVWVWWMAQLKRKKHADPRVPTSKAAL